MEKTSFISNICLDAVMIFLVKTLQKCVFLGLVPSSVVIVTK